MWPNRCLPPTIVDGNWYVLMKFHIYFYKNLFFSAKTKKTEKNSTENHPKTGKGVTHPKKIPNLVFFQLCDTLTVFWGFFVVFSSFFFFEIFTEKITDLYKKIWSFIKKKHKKCVGWRVADSGWGAMCSANNRTNQDMSKKRAGDKQLLDYICYLLTSICSCVHTSWNKK